MKTEAQNDGGNLLRIAVIGGGIAGLMISAILLCGPESADTIRVTFELHSPDLPANSEVYLAGGTTALGNWDPGKAKMEPAGEQRWRREVSFDREMTFEYKYTLGSWEHEGAGADGKPLPSFEARIDGDKTISDRVLFWTVKQHVPEIRGQVTGTVRYHRDMQWEGLADRDLVVWLPPDYDGQTQQRYPVLYMHDGKNILDPATSSFGVDWSVDETADSLIRNGEIPPLIIVGINNTSDRTAEYSPGVKGDAYMDFLINGVKPLIDSTYRTLPGRQHTLVGGSSMGGLISFMLAWEHDDVFSAAICMSPAFKLAEFDYVSPVLASSGEPKDVFFYIDNGGFGLERELQPGIDQMLEALRERGYEQGRHFVFVKDPEARHFESAWAERFPEALKSSLSAMKHR